MSANAAPIRTFTGPQGPGSSHVAFSNSDAQFLYKTLYPQGIDQEALVRNKPLMQWVDNDPDFTTGKNMEIPAAYVNPQGIGSTNANAAANEVGSKGVMFQVPQRHTIALGALDADVVRNTKAGGDASQFTDMLQAQVDGITEAIGTEVHQRMYGDNTAVRSFLSATGAINTTTFYLANAEDCQFYEPNMKIVLVNPATGAARVGTAVTITSVDVDNGALICSGNPNSFTSAAAGDGIARSTMVGADMDGLKAWCPVSVGPSDSFMGVNRSVYRTRLAGVYYDASGKPIRTGFINALAKAKAQVGSMFERKSPFFINPKNLAQIVQSVESTRVTTGAIEDKYGIGLETIDVFGHKFVEDALCPVNTAWLIGQNALVRATAGKQPQLDDQDGNQFWYNRRTGQLEFVLAHDGNIAALEAYNVMQVTLPNQAL